MIPTQIPCMIFGASGYAGVELCKLINGHPMLYLHQLCVSEQSSDAGKALSELYPDLIGQIDLPLLPANQATLQALTQFAMESSKVLVFLATPHEFSHELVAKLAGLPDCIIFDLSGAYRLKQANLYAKYYGFEHEHSSLLEHATYGLAEYVSDATEQQLFSVPGCYPTAAQLALKPIIDEGFLAPNAPVVINAISGVSGAGRSASLATSFMQLSLKPYNLFIHRHRPEIEQGLGVPVVFTPHVCDFERGIIATITVSVAENVTAQTIKHAFDTAYSNQPLVRLRTQPPAIKDVARTPYCDIYWQLEDQTLIIISAIDNLLKGAASQAIQCANLHLGQSSALGLLPGTGVAQ